MRAFEDEGDETVELWTTWSAVLLGDRRDALNALWQTFIDGRKSNRAFRLALQAESIQGGHRRVQALATRCDGQRWLLKGAGIIGDPVYVPWLLKCMADPRTARPAAEAFCLICGVDLVAQHLDGVNPLQSAPLGETDRRSDDGELDLDLGSPWPDLQKIQKWWANNGQLFLAGQRYFMGKPVTRDHCIQILKTGFQRQRILAAQYLCLLQPGTPLFNTSAPAWRQQRLLAQMT
jgi:uncharacterized protein (TIGR02270 family)